MVRIKYWGKEGECGASLINSRWLLSAGHCVSERESDNLYDYRQVYAILGDYDITAPNEGTEVQRNISKIIRHPKYKWVFDDNVPEYDIALLSMKKDIDFIKYPHIRPACLPSDTLEDYAGWDATLTGWGYKLHSLRPEKLQYLTGPVQRNQECYKEIKWSSPAFPDSFLCVSDTGGRPCFLDSGAPLVTKPVGDDGMTPGQNYQQIGVMSFGKGTPCNSTGYGVFSRVTTVLAWIRDSLGTGHTDCPRE